ncbi:PREDICTED: pepsin A-like, partial [Merops nubicus]|uniref:pepsin A-like n=1 Tax=Merops nubicus TaxID=57421 RepID=UPI0004F086C7
DSMMGSFILFGAIDPAYTTNGITWIPLSAETYWQVTMDRVTARGKPLACTHGCQAIVDTGTSRLVVPSKALSRIQAAFGTTSDGQISCSRVPLLPKIVFHIGGKPFPVPPTSYVVQEDGECILGFQGMDIPTEAGEIWILGDIFIRNYYVIFNRANNMVGLSRLP